MGTIYLWTILAYLLGLVVVGLKGSRGVASQEDFSVAGRRLSTFVLFGTLLATWIGTGSIFGNAEKTYRVGVAAAILPVASLLGIAVLYFLAGRVRGLERSSYYYAPRPRNDQGLRGALRKLALRHRRWGYQTLTELLRREGWRDNHKRIYRIYREEGLQVRWRKRKRAARWRGERLEAPQGPNEIWAMDFMNDQLADGRRLRVLPIIDVDTRR